MRRTPQTYALTLNAFDKRRLFQRIANAELLIHTIFRYRDAGKFLVHGFVVMPNHLHLMLSPNESIEKAIQLIKGGYSFAIREQHKGEVWQHGNFAHRVTDSQDYFAQLGYIANNPVRKQYADYPFVHTTKTWQMDETPDVFR